jgi:feruloyl esterase
MEVGFLKIHRLAVRAVAGTLALALLAPAATVASPGDAWRTVHPHAYGSFLDYRNGHVDYTARHTLAAKTCASLKGAVFSDATIVTATTEVAATSTVPAFCDATGTIEGTIAFEVALPTTWNGRLYVWGNGGFAGEPFAEYYTPERSGALQAGFVYAHSNTGHYGKGAIPLFDASWAYNNSQAVVNWANRSVHVLAAASKAIVTSYYAKKPTRSYFEGCSDGGGEAFTEAEKYPSDFDGIVGGDPLLEGTDSFVEGIYATQQYGSAPFTLKQIAPEANAVMAACDKLDGLVDGLISDPRRCTFNPSTEGKSLSAAQLKVWENLLAGARNQYGQLEYGAVLGSEYDDGLAGILIPATAGAAEIFTEGWTQFIAPFPFSGNVFSIPTFNFNTDPYRLSAIASVENAENPNLDGFTGHGGKLIAYHGWADPLITPYVSVAYTESVFNRIGVAKAQDSFREFMIPGMGHCQGTGYGPNVFDPITPLVDWVEAGIAPASIVAERLNAAGTAPVLTRPLCPYPQEATYVSGNPNVATSFTCKAGLRGLPFPKIGRPIPTYPFVEIHT